MPKSEEKPLPQKRKKPLWLKIILIILALLFLSFFAFFFSPLRFLPFLLIDKLAGKKLAFPQKQIFKTKKPTPLPDKAVKKKIIAQEGGQLTVNHPKGYTITLNIPPNALEEDTEITLTPTEDDPIDDGDDDPGVVVDPPEVDFDPPADLEFVPSEPPPAEVVPDTTEPDTDAGFDFQPPVKGPPLASASPAADLGTRTSLDPFSQFVFVDRDNNIHITSFRPGPYFWAIGGLIKTGGDAAANDDPTQADLEKAADQAAKNSGNTCTDEFLQALMALINYLKSKGAEAEQARTRYGQLLEECEENQCLTRIENLCQTNRMGLRRQMFEDCWNTIVMISGNNDKAQRVMVLKDTCTAQYQFTVSATHPQSQGGVTLQGYINAEVCGYLDDKWEGQYRYDTIANVSGGSGDHYITSDINFNLPPLGGRFSINCENTQSGLELMGTFIPVPLPLTGAWPGTFDGISWVSARTYADILLQDQIKLVSEGCGDVVPPLAPLPGGPDQLPPLAPLPGNLPDDNQLPPLEPLPGSQ